jgi:hypothetical protein
MKIENAAAWFIEPKLYDKGRQDLICSYSGRKARYFFRASVKNQKGKGTFIAIDSSVNFNIRGIDPGDEAAWINQESTTLKREARLNRLKQLLIKLKKLEPSFNYSLIWANIKNEYPLSPKQFVFLVELANKHDIKLNDDIIPLGLQNTSNKEIISKYPTKKIDIIKEFTPKRQHVVIDKLRLGEKYVS